MLATYGGGHAIDMEIREKHPRADGYFHVDTERTLAELAMLNANTHYFLMWHSPSDWQDFTEEFLPAAQKAGVDVWAYIVPPSECHPDGWCSRPYGTDYVAWAENVAELSVEFDRLKGWVIDDFVNGDNQETFTTKCMQQIQKAMKSINPRLKLETVAYYGVGAIDDEFYEKYAPYIDGVVFPYRDEPHNNTLRSSTLAQQVDAVTSCAEKYVLDVNLLLYTGRCGTFDSPTAGYVEDLLATGRRYVREGRIHGIVSYGTPHLGSRAISSENEAMYGNGRLALHAFAGTPEDGDHGAASQVIAVDPTAERFTLNFWVHNRFFGKEAEGTRFVEVLINDEVIWSKDVVKEFGNDLDGRWRQSEGPIEIDRSVVGGKSSAKLTFRIRQDVPASFRMTASFDALETSGLRVENSDFESPHGWEPTSTHGAFVPEVEIWEHDRPGRVFAAVARGIRAMRS